MGYFIKEIVKCWYFGATQEAQITKHTKLPAALSSLSQKK